jgi:hypothetical protein
VPGRAGLAKGRHFRVTEAPLPTLLALGRPRVIVEGTVGALVTARGTQEASVGTQPARKAALATEGWLKGTLGE